MLSKQHNAAMDYIAIVWLMLLSMAIFDGMHNVGDGTQIANGKFPTTVARLWTPRIIFRPAINIMRENICHTLGGGRCEWGA